MKKITTQTSLFGAVLALAAVLLASIPAHAQYMSYFGDSSWQYHVTYITQPPEDYLNYPPEEPNLLGVYCRTILYNFTKDCYYPEYDHYSCDVTDALLEESAALWEDTVNGRLYLVYKGEDYPISDMSLSEGDTFVNKGTCSLFYGGVNIAYMGHYEMDTVRYTMLVDSVRYVSGRKTIYLSLLDHLDDYFFGIGNGGGLSSYNFSIRFIEGIGPTYGIMSRECIFPKVDSLGHYVDSYLYLEPWLPLLQCMYKDDSLIYMADEALGCNQTCVGIEERSQLIVNLYPNPATQYVVLDMSTGEEMDGRVVVTDMLGRQCFQQKAEGTRVRIPVTDLPTGMYFLTYTDGKRTVTRKFMKES